MFKSQAQINERWEYLNHTYPWHAGYIFGLCDKGHVIQLNFPLVYYFNYDGNVPVQNNAKPQNVLYICSRDTFYSQV